MLRRWDLVALVGLLAVPFVALGIYVKAAWNVDDVVADLDRSLLMLQATAPRGPTADLDALAKLGDTALTTDARQEVDAILTGDKPPWELSASTQTELADDDTARAALVDAFSSGAHSRPLTVGERACAADLAREIAIAALRSRSRGHSADADATCAHGYGLAVALTGGGVLDDAIAAADIFRVVDATCGESMGSADRASRIDGIKAVLDIAKQPVSARAVVERDRVHTLVGMHHRAIGPLPAAVALHLPTEWRFELAGPPPTSKLLLVSKSERLFSRLAMRAFATASAQAIGRDEASMPAVPPNVEAPFDDPKAPYRAAIVKARAGVDFETSTFRVVLARLVAEIFVIDHKRWPTSAAEFHVAGDEALDARIQSTLHAQTIDLLEHDVYLTIIIDGARSTRATLPDELSSLAR